MYSEELVLDEVLPQKGSAVVKEEKSLNSIDKTAALLGLANEDTINSKSEVSSVDVARRLNYSGAHRGKSFNGRAGGASRRYQSDESEYASDEDSRIHQPSVSVATPHTTTTMTAAAPSHPMLMIQRGGRTQYLNTSGTSYYDDGAALDLDEVEAAAFDLREEFNQPLPIVYNDQPCEEFEELTVTQVPSAVSMEPEAPVVAPEPTEDQLQAYAQLLRVAETVQAKRFLLQPLVFATVDQELMMISAPLHTGKVVDVGGCVGDLLYCVPLPPAAELEGAALGLFVTAAFHEADGTNETIVCQKILSGAEVERYRELYSMQDSSNSVVAQDPDPLVNSLYFQNRIVDCDWKSRYNGANCPLLDSEMWLQHRVTPTDSDGTLQQVQTSLDRLCTLVDAIGAVVNRIIVKYRPDADQILTATRRLERIKAEFTLMSNDDVRPMFRMRWTNGMNLAANLATNKLAFLRTKRPLLADGVTRSNTEVDTEVWSGLCSLHHRDYSDLPMSGLPEDLPTSLVKYVLMAISAVGMCLHEVRARECVVQECDLLNGNVRLLVCTKFDDIY